MTKELEAAMLKVETFLDRTKLVSSSPTDGEIAAIEMLVTALATPAEPVCSDPECGYNPQHIASCQEAK